VVHGRLHLVLSAACDSRDAHHIRVTRLLAIGTIAIDRGCGLLKMLLASFTTTLGTLHGVLDGDGERCLPAVAWARKSWAATLLVVYWVMTLCTSSMVFLMIWADAWKGCVSGTSHVLLLGASSPGPLGSRLCLLRPQGLLWCGFHV
jgi:hypothetical protein